ncbi:MAG: fumarylacetoacetate hydrolase family protein [Thermoguttaceae bacterium]|nr:fumarylacetoacetate hydrolase family protein [Thermoguttaceae bacterium]MDO4424871.1 fumarylacetoacetate hydrolase family protein [Planctomycetia bacterium]
MKLTSCLTPNGPRAAALAEDGKSLVIFEVSVKELFLKENWLEYVKKFVQDTLDGRRPPCLVPVEEARLLTPVPDPQKIACVGLNYADHAAETGDSVPDAPVIFNKFPSALCGNGDVIELPAVSDKVDYEAELVVVIGKKGRNIPIESAMEYVAGYCCGNDVSARDWQMRPPARQWFIGKTFDGFAPVGPWMVTADEIPDPRNLEIELRLNGEVMQKSNTNQFIFSVPTLINWISQAATLLPGDLIFTGTPPGVGMGRKPPLFLKDGDLCEVEIEKIGVLGNLFKAEKKN